MDTRKNLSVLPSNGHDLSPNPVIPSSISNGFDSLQSQICQKFNRGLECRVCNLHHICSICEQSGHGAHFCQAANLRHGSRTASSTPSETGVFDSRSRATNHYAVKPPHLFPNPPYHTAQAAIRVAQKKERRNIWQRWELNSHRYQAYRRKARSKKPGSREDVWPDHVEEAFQIAIRLYAKRGRTKDELNGKQAGGNEFISEWIKKQTGEGRNRKQISSHIQTLKSFLSDVPEWMDLVTAFPTGKQDRENVLNHSKTGMRDLSELVSSESPDWDSTVRSAAIKPPAPAILGSNSHTEPGIRAVQFDMHLSNKAEKKIHIYTSIQSDIGSSPQALDQILNWRARFPEVANKYDDNRLDCPLYHFESRIRLVDEIRMGLTSLGIEFAIDFGGASHFNDWRSFTRVHKQGFVPQDFDDAEFEKSPSDVLELSKTEQGETYLMIPFKSRWWVKLFSSMIARRIEARKTKDPDSIKWAEEYPSSYLRELSITQEIWATPRGRSGIRTQRSRRMAILLWTFNQVRNGEAASTSWRPLTVSYLSPFQIQEPDTRVLQPPMSLDSALHATMSFQQQQEPHHQMESLEESYSEHDQHAFLEHAHGMLASQTSSCDTDSTTPILDYQSFPSSTSTSFPSSISSSTYPNHHGSSFGSQDSYMQSMEAAFAPYREHQQYHIHDAEILKTHPATASVYSSQDSIYDSNPPSANGILASFTPFERHEPEDESTLVADASQAGFMTAGIHIASPMTHIHGGLQDRGEPYEVPIVAPRANMLVPQHLEQQLESFERWVPPIPHVVLTPSQEHPEQELIHAQVGMNGARPAANGELENDAEATPAEGEMAGDEESRLTDFHTQQQQQLEYFNEAAQYWQQNFDQPGGLQLLGLEQQHQHQQSQQQQRAHDQDRHGNSDEDRMNMDEEGEDGFEAVDMPDPRQSHQRGPQSETQQQQPPSPSRATSQLLRDVPEHQTTVAENENDRVGLL